MMRTGTVVVELPTVKLGAGETVLAAALTLFGADTTVLVCLAGVDEPVARQRDYVAGICQRILAGGSPSVDGSSPITVTGVATAADSPHIVRVVAWPEPLRAAREVVTLAAIAAAMRVSRLTLHDDFDAQPHRSTTDRLADGQRTLEPWASRRIVQTPFRMPNTTAAHGG